jgi:hypothetical protein
MSSFFGGSPDDPDPTTQEQALAEVAVKDWNDYKYRYIPVENQYLSRIRATPGDYNSVRGAAVADVQQAVGGQANKIIGQASNSKAGLLDLVLATGQARGNAANQAQLARQTAELRGLSKMAAFGRGLADQSRVGLASTASGANAKNITDLQTDIDNTNMKLEAVGGGLGTYAGYKGWLQKKPTTEGK